MADVPETTEVAQRTIETMESVVQVGNDSVSILKNLLSGTHFGGVELWEFFVVTTAVTLFGILIAAIKRPLFIHLEKETKSDFRRRFYINSRHFFRLDTLKRKGIYAASVLVLGFVITRLVRAHINIDFLASCNHAIVALAVVFYLRSKVETFMPAFLQNTENRKWNPGILIGLINDFLMFVGLGYILIIYSVDLAALFSLSNPGLIVSAAVLGFLPSLFGQFRARSSLRRNHIAYRGDLVEVDGDIMTLVGSEQSHTIFKLSDGDRLTIPNDRLAGMSIRNLSTRDRVGVPLKIGLALDQDVSGFPDLLWIIKEHIAEKEDCVAVNWVRIEPTAGAHVINCKYSLDIGTDDMNLVRTEIYAEIIGFLRLKGIKLSKSAHITL